MVSLARKYDTLVIRISGVNKVWALRNRIVIPFDSIEDVTVNLDDKIAIWPGIRMPGVHMPGVIVAGTYITRNGKHFYLRKKGKESIILDLVDHKFSRVVVDVADPIDAVSQIITWMDDGDVIQPHSIRITR